MCSKYQDLVGVLSPVLPAPAKAGYVQRATALHASSGGFGQAVNGALRDLQVHEHV